MHILVFTLENQRYALDLAIIDRCILAVEVFPLPNMPPHLIGAANVHGTVVPVINTRSLLGLQGRPLEAQDRFIICKGLPERVILWVDDIKEVTTCDSSSLGGPKESGHTVLEEKGVVTLLLNLENLLSHRAVSVGNS